MPRQKISDPTNEGRYVQVNWRRAADHDGDTQYVQVSTHHEGESTVSHLLGWAIGIISNVDAPAVGWPNQTSEWQETARAWLDKAASHSSETTGEYVQVGPEEIDRAIRTLHKAKRQAFGDLPAGPPPRPIRVIGDEQVAAAERGVYLPREGRTV